MLQYLKKRKLTIILIFATLFLGAFLLAGLFADAIAAKFLFHPWKPAASWKATSEHCEEVHFASVDGSMLHGLYFPCENARGVALYSHGNGDIVKSCEALGEFLREEFQLSVLVYDYRGYGLSEGQPTASGVLQDARAARRFLAERENVAETEIIQIGFSLGGAVAVDLASLDGAKALIVISSFTSLPDMSERLFPFFPAGFFLREQLKSVEKIENCSCPVLISHGTRDQVIPYHQGQELFQAAREPKTFFTAEGGEHSFEWTPEYVETLRTFLESVSL